MKKSSYIINISRGPVIDEKALIIALCNDIIAGAGLDVYWNRTPENSCILEHKDKLVLTPHIGSATYESQDRIGDEIVEHVKNLN
jgi:D-3-phosphoglycerate dehydrogenase